MKQPENYRRSDQYYIDDYDRCTIEVMSVLEKEMLAAEQLFLIEPDQLNSPQNNNEYPSKRIKYLDTGVARDRNKRQAIEECIRIDEWKDSVIKRQLIPDNIFCLYCGENMHFEMYDFLEDFKTFLMWFSCCHGHAPKRAFYNNGKEYKPVEVRCSDCGGGVKSVTKKTKKKITITDRCTVCKKQTIVDFSRSLPKILPIDEADRKKYCTDFIGRKNFVEDLSALAGLSKLTEESEAKVKFEFSNIQKINIAQLEEMLTAAIDKTGFIKIQFEKPKISRYLTVELSVQDTVDREAEKSVKVLKKLIGTALFKTNWRLMSPGFNYRLGFLSGQLKGYSLDEDLLKIAEEVWKKTRSGSY